jgi:hypothetical protein
VLAPVPYAQPEHFANDVEVITQASGNLKDFDVSRIIDNSLVKSAEERGLAKS